MNRNTEQHFALNPFVDRARSKFNIPQDIKTTFNTGELVPFYVQEILPGDSAKIKTNKVVRLQTPLTPFMDNIYLDTYYFFVPSRLVWSHWQNFMGESDSAWLPEVSYTVPQVTAPTDGWTKGTIADQMGLPTGVDNISVSDLPFRAYAKIVQDWFLWTPLQDPVNIPVNETTLTGTNGSDYINDLCKGGKPFIAKKTANYFTMALPTPQRGPASTIQLADISGPVYGTGKALALTQGTDLWGLGFDTNCDFTANANIFGTDVSGSTTLSAMGKANAIIGVPTKAQIEASSGSTVDMTGLVAEMNNSTLVTINELRQAFQIQKWYEQLARGGDRYISILKEMFGVTSPDARLQRSEYLGGNRVPIEVNQIIQTSATQYSASEDLRAISGNPMGTAGAYSVTVDSHYDVDKSFVEHGYLIGCCVARYDNTFQQGIERFWSRTTKFDYYWPVFQNLGEMAIKNKEIFAQGSDVVNSETGVAYDEEVFGYQEAWADYRYKPNHICGEMRSTYSTPLDSWHLGDDYDTLPSLSDTWIQTDKTNVDRVLTVSSTVADQFFADIFVENEMIRPMPLYSIPGLMDHH